MSKNLFTISSNKDKPAHIMKRELDDMMLDMKINTHKIIIDFLNELLNKKYVIITQFKRIDHNSFSKSDKEIQTIVNKHKITFKNKFGIEIIDFISNEDTNIFDYIIDIIKNLLKKINHRLVKCITKDGNNYFYIRNTDY